MTEEQKGIMGVLIDRFIAVWSPGGSLAASPVLCFTCCSHALIQFPVPRRLFATPPLLFWESFYPPFFFFLTLKAAA